MGTTSIRRLAVVTGATGGIGAAVSRTLSRDGFAVVVQFNSNRAAADELVSSIHAEGGSAHALQADLGTDAGVARFGDEVAELLRTHPEYELHALVNNAAKLLGPSFFDATPEQFDVYFAINTKAPFFLAQRLSTLMTAGGAIVNVSSAGVHFSSPGDIVYAMSKAAVESLTVNMAEAVAKLGIRVNAVIPGFTDNGHDAFKVEAVLEYMSGFAVLGGVSQPETVAEAIAFLVSDRASRTTGTTLDVSGGSTIGARGSRAGSVAHLIQGAEPA